MLKNVINGNECQQSLSYSNNLAQPQQQRPTSHRIQSTPRTNNVFVIILLTYSLGWHFEMIFAQNQALVIGGHFTTTSDLFNLLSWSNGEWTEIGGGLQSSTNYNEILCLDESKYGLVIGGNFRFLFSLSLTFVYSITIKIDNKKQSNLNRLVIILDYLDYLGCKILLFIMAQTIFNGDE
jgi:hypothetical protein